MWNTIILKMTPFETVIQSDEFFCGITLGIEGYLGLLIQQQAS